MGAACESQTSPTLLGRLKDLGDAQAWKEFVHRYAPRIYGWCRKHGLQDADAQDLTQAIVVKVALVVPVPHGCPCVTSTRPQEPTVVS